MQFMSIDRQVPDIKKSVPEQSYLLLYDTEWTLDFKQFYYLTELN